MRILVASNSTSKRTDYFIKAGRSLGADTCFVTYDELSAVLPDCRDTVVKLEPPVFREADFRKYNLLCEEYRSLLSRLADTDKSESVHFLNEPTAILCALDKVYTQRKLTGAGLKTTPLLSDALSTFDDLAAILCRQKRGGFLKPRYGSGAGGIMAVRYNHRRDEWVAYTTMSWEGGRVCNAKRICRLTNRKEIATLAEEVIRCGAVLEEWMAKEKLEGENYDLRVVCRGDEVDYVVVRCSDGAITNLHLNNKARLFEELSLAPSVREELFCRSITAMKALGLRYAGIDVLIARNTDTPYIIEVNGQGDHIYQDMYTENKIYANQIKTIESLFNGNR